jgi:hypothetical protein
MNLSRGRARCGLIGWTLQIDGKRSHKPTHLLIQHASLSGSPWIRGAPQSGFSMLIRRIKARSSALICGRPPNERDFQRQYRRKPARCQRTRVSGRMTVMTFRTDGNHRYSWMKNKRSLFVSRTRLCTIRRNTTTWCRSAAFSASSLIPSPNQYG